MLAGNKEALTQATPKKVLSDYNAVEVAEKLLAKFFTGLNRVEKETLSETTSATSEPQLVGRWVYEGDKLICRWE